MEYPDWDEIAKRWHAMDLAYERRRRLIRETTRAALIRIAHEGSHPTGPYREHRCRVWDGRLDRDGYAIWRGLRLARLLALSVYGPGRIDLDGTVWDRDDLWADHLCHNEAWALGCCAPGPCWHRACVEPTHLTLVTPAENAQRKFVPFYEGDD